MKVLFIAPYVPSRIRVRPFQLIKELALRHSVHVIALGEPGSEKIDGVDEIMEAAASFRVVPHSQVRGYCQSLVALPTSSPMCTAFCWSSDASRIIADACSSERFDLVHVEHLRAAHLVPRSLQVPVVFDSVDCLSGLFHQMSRGGRNIISRLVMMEEAWKLKRYEPRMLRGFDRVVITSEAERDMLVGLDRSLKVDVLPNGVDTRYFHPNGLQKHPRRTVFSGKMSYSPNAQAALWFAENVFPALRSKWPDAEFVIAGNEPPDRIKKLADQPGITVTGYVPDLRPHLDSSTLAVAPMQVAVGVQNKVLEAMSMAMPVVVSPLAARTAHECKSMVSADAPQEWVARISELIDSPERLKLLGDANRQFVEENHSWRSSAGTLEAIYTDLVQRRTP